VCSYSHRLRLRRAEAKATRLRRGRATYHGVDIVCSACKTDCRRTSLSLRPAEEFFRVIDEPDRCSNCGRAPPADEYALDGWHAEADGVGGLYVFCPECWDREFGDDRLD
jgi:hypothetical protein